jgi:hypothetical protein
MGMFNMMIMFMHMFLSSQMKMRMAVFPVLNQVTDANDHIYKTKCDKEPGSYVPAE